MSLQAGQGSGRAEKGFFAANCNSLIPRGHPPASLALSKRQAFATGEFAAGATRRRTILEARLRAACVENSFSLKATQPTRALRMSLFEPLACPIPMGRPASVHKTTSTGEIPTDMHPSNPYRRVSNRKSGAKSM